MKISITPLTRKIALSFAIVLLLFSAGLFYVNKILLPIQIKGLAIKAASEALHRNVTFDSLQFSPFHGFVITDLLISERNTPEQPFIQAKTASIQIMFFALLQKKIIIPSLRIGSASIRITRTEKDLWNFSDLLNAEPSDKTGPEMDLLVSGFSLNNTTVLIRDTSLGDDFSETISAPVIKGAFSLKGSFNISGTIAFPSTNGNLKFDARIGMQNNSFKGAFEIKNIIVSRYLRFYPETLPADIQNLIIAEGNVSTTMQGKNASIAGDLSLPAISVKMPDGTSFTGDLTLNGLLAGVNNENISVQGALHATKISLAQPAGLKANLSVLRAGNIQFTRQQNKLSASADIDVRELSVAPSAGQEFKSNITFQGFKCLQNEKGFVLSADIKTDGLSLTMGEGRTFSGSALIKHATATIAGASIEVKADVEMNSAALAMPGSSLTTDILAPGTRVTFDTGRIESTIQATFKKMTAKSGELTASGSPALNAHIIMDPNAKEPLSYNGSLELSSLAVTGLPTVNEIKNIQGAIAFETGIAQTKELSFSVLDTPVKISGEIAHFEAPELNINATSEKINLTLLEKFIPDIVKEHDLAIKGTAALTLSFSGLLAKLQEGKINATATLKDVNIDSRKLKQSVSDMNGLVLYNAPLLSWKDISANYQGKTWSSNGTLQDFLNPVIDASLKTNDLNAKIRIKKAAEKLQVMSISGAYFDSTYELIGDVFLVPGKMPAVSMSGEFKLSLRDLPKMLPPEQAKQIDALKLSGILKIKADVKGEPQNWQELSSVFTIQTPALYMMGYQIADLSVEGRQKDGQIDPLTIKGKLYGGDLNVVTSIDLKERKFPFKTGVKLDSLSLELLKKDTPLKQQQLSGALSATTNLKGELLDIRKMTGDASVKIANGYLWELEILSNVLSILSSTFQGGDVIITDADATFKIADQKVMTDNLTLRSATVSLVGEGWVDFDQNIDLNITPRLETKATEGVTNPLGALNPTAGIVNIRVYNTLTAPKFENNITAPQIIKKTLQNTVGSILKLFE